MHTEASNGAKVSQWPQQYGSQLYRYAFGRLRDSASAEDVVQETYAAAIGSLEKFKSNSSERAWLFGILKHKIVDYCRSNEKTRSESFLEREDYKSPLEKLANEDSKAVTSGSYNPQPEKKAQGEALAKLCKHELEEMPQNLAQTFRLHVLRGLETEEICNRLSISKQNLWVRVHRARRILQKKVKKQW